MRRINATPGAADLANFITHCVRSSSCTFVSIPLNHHNGRHQPRIRQPGYPTFRLAVTKSPTIVIVSSIDRVLPGISNFV